MFCFATKKYAPSILDYLFLCSNTSLKRFYFFIYFLNFIYLFLEKGEGRKKERERNINVWLPLDCPLLGTWPSTQACALTGNLSRDLWCTGQHSIHRATPARADFFIFRERGREEEREGEKHRLVASCTCPNQGSYLQSWYVP